MKETTNPSVLLQNASYIAKIILAILAMSAFLIATLHFAIQIEFAPRFLAIDAQFQTIQFRLSDIDRELTAIEKAIRESKDNV